MGYIRATNTKIFIGNDDGTWAGLDALVAELDDAPMRMPLYFYADTYPWAVIHEAAMKAGVDWAALCDVVELPKGDISAFVEWLCEYLQEFSS